MRLIAVMGMAVLAAAPGFVVAQDRPADTMEILRQKLRADKKLVVAATLGLTESGARNFWPVYEAYQGELEKLDARLVDVIAKYAVAYNADSLTDAQARVLLDEALAIDEAEAGLRTAYACKLELALPGRKLARYVQLENKIRAVIRYDIASQVPLAR